MGSTNVLLLAFLFTSLIIHAANSSSSNERCIQSEWEALMEFKGSLLNDSSKLSSWTGRDCCSWKGITCHNSTGHVQTLDLGYQLTDDFNFSSPLSPWLFNLSSLEYLRIFGSGLQGHIPDMFEKLPSLIYLDLSFNSFGSPLPDSLCSLTSLSKLHLTACELKGPIPPCLGNLTSLTTLFLGNNKLSGKIPSELSYLTHLTYLELTENHLISSIPSSLGHLSELEYLSLGFNQLSGTIPSSLGNLTKLTYLDLNVNSLMGELSESFFEKLDGLKKLGMSENKGIVLNLSSQWIPPFQIEEMDMDYVFIGTEFPRWLQTQRNLAILNMHNVSISGAIPDWYLTAFSNLYTIDLSNNFLTGSVPNMILTGLTDLRSIDLSNNFLSGSLPTFDGADLEILSIANNQFTGPIPPRLGSLRNLTVLNLGDNNLSGQIPDELGSLSLLRNLYLSGNKFSGKLSESLQNMASLQTLDIGKNELHGSIPQWVGMNWSSLRYLILESNNFSGDIPLNLCRLQSLQILNLALNNLVGTIPRCFGNLSMMSSESIPDLADIYVNEAILNYIKGKEMKFTSSLRYARFISLSGNHLHGEIVELMNLKGLQSLNLSNNEFIGMIPETINNLTHLESLDLSMNHFSGNIPTSLANIDTLEYLNLSFNNLGGRIPSGNHFNTLYNASIFQGNEELCGELLMKRCPGDDSGHVSDVDGHDEFDRLPWMYAGIGPGFAVGFLTVICSLHFKDQWRVAFTGIVDNVCNKLW